MSKGNNLTSECTSPMCEIMRTRTHLCRSSGWVNAIGVTFITWKNWEVYIFGGLDLRGSLEAV